MYRDAPGPPVASGHQNGCALGVCRVSSVCVTVLQK